MLILPDAWTWDLWILDDGDRFHAFYLRASRALVDPDRRHLRASIGHAVSADLRTWTVLPDALTHADGPAFDDLATWTGSVVRNPAGGWRMFYTGIDQVHRGRLQRIGSADSDDLVTWRRSAPPQGLAADPRWYATLAGGARDEDWRDPWVYPDPAGDGWHMLVTAVAAGGEPRGGAVVGHATSPDLDTWTVRPPLSAADAGFGHLEVMQVAVVLGRPVLIFSCFDTDHSRTTEAAAGMWSLPLDATTGPFDLKRAQPLTGPELYAGRLVQDRSGRWVLLAFQAEDKGGEFVGGITDPISVAWSPDGATHLVLTT